MRNRVLTIFFAMTAFICSGQAFLAKYPKLTKKNLNEFFLDWKAYSDTITSNYVITDSVIADIIMWNNVIFGLEGRPTNEPKYNVVPQTIKIERYFLDVDTVMAKLCLGFPEFLEDLKDDQYVVDSVTPVLPWRGLYLTSDINKKLSSFAGGLKNGDKI